MNTRMVLLLTLVAALLGTSAVAAAQSPTDTPPADEQNELEAAVGLPGSTWALVSIGGPAEEILIEQDSEITLNFLTASEFEGWGGCNSYSGTYASDGGSTVGFSDIVSTRMACANDALTAQETNYLSTLEEATRYRLAGDRLSLSTADGRVLTFVATGAYALLHSQWQLVAMGASGDLTDAVEATVVTLEFPNAEQITGYGGCNGYDGLYQADDENIAFSEVNSTLIACEDEAVMEQELAYFDLLGLVARYELVDGRLVLRSEDGARELHYAPSGSYALRRTRWQLSSMSTGGRDARPLESAPITLEFMTQTESGGSSGCNSYNGTYSIEGDDIAFEQIISTLMACSDTLVMAQEASYLDALRDVTGYDVVDGALRLYTPDGHLEFTPVSSPVVSGAA